VARDCVKSVPPGVFAMRRGEITLWAGVIRALRTPLAVDLTCIRLLMEERKERLQALGERKEFFK
jgi:hypothetical protein